MIALDTNVLVRFLVNDDFAQASAARALLESLSNRSRGFVCREVAVELAWVLDQAYRFSRDQIAGVFEDLVASAELEFEAAEDVVRAADGLRRVGFSDQMIAAAARRCGADKLYTFDSRPIAIRLVHPSPHPSPQRSGRAGYEQQDSDGLRRGSPRDFQTR